MTQLRLGTVNAVSILRRDGYGSSLRHVPLCRTGLDSIVELLTATRAFSLGFRQQGQPATNTFEADANEVVSAGARHQTRLHLFAVGGRL
jgi:hypothetical protein